MSRTSPSHQREGTVPRDRSPCPWRVVAPIAIASVGSSALLGDCAVHTIADQPATFEIGITLARSSQGQGYATEALRLLLAALFGAAGAERVVAHAEEGNVAVRRLLERLGLHDEARVIDPEDAVSSDGTAMVLGRYGIDAADWPPA